MNNNSIPADAICMECGTTKENAETGFCINGHDNWLELTDDLSRFDQAIIKLNSSSFVIIHAIMTNTDIEIKRNTTRTRRIRALNKTTKP